MQQTNCHPFSHGRWLFMHNGVVHDFAKVKRDLVVAGRPLALPEHHRARPTRRCSSSSRSRTGSRTTRPAAIARTIGLVEHVGRAHGVEFPFQGTIATTDGERVWAFRYSSEGKSRTLYFSSEIESLRELYPDIELLQRASATRSRIVVSEPLGDVPGVWNEIPESSWGVIQPGRDELHPFEPVAPGSLVSA